MYILPTDIVYPAGCHPVEFVYVLDICLCSINLSLNLGRR